MPNLAEKLIERLINDGIITESELEQRIQEAKENSPLASLPTMQSDIALIVYDSINKDIKIEQLEQQNAEMLYTIMMGAV